MKTSPDYAYLRDRVSRLLALQPIFQAIMDGKQVQVLKREDGEWEDIDYRYAYGWNFDDGLPGPEGYRIKPEPVELEVWYKPDSGQVFDVIPGDGLSWGKWGYRKMKMREVIE